MLVVKMLLLVTCPACSALILAPLFLGPPHPYVYIAFAIAQPMAAVAFYRLIKRAVFLETLNEIDRRRGRATKPVVNARYQVR